MANEDAQTIQATSHAMSPYPQLKAKLEPFDSYWQAPSNVESGYNKFEAYYRTNYLPHLPGDKAARILVISCGPGYLVNLLAKEGYSNVKGVDSDPAKIEYAKAKGLNCSVSMAFDCLIGEQGLFDVIIPEQELNHLTLDEQIAFLELCRERLKPGGLLVVYGLNGANPLVGSENLAHNIDHFNLFTDYSLKQILELGGFADIKVMPLKLYVFWKNPLNYVGLAVTSLLELFFRACFILYGKDVKVLSKKLAATARAPHGPASGH